MEFINQSITALRLYIIRSPYTMEDFTVLKEAKTPWNKHTVRYGILGESHFISVENTRFSFHEICACTGASFTDVKVPVKKMLTEFSAEDMPYCYQDGSLSYTFERRVISIENSIEQLNMLNEPEYTNLTYIFPNNELQHDPFTHLSLLIKEDSLTVESIHTYPNQEVAMYTKSVLTI